MLHKWDWKYTMELALINGYKNKRKIWKKLDKLKTTTNLKNTSFEDNEILDIMNEFYQITINLMISILFLIQHNHILPRLIVYKTAFDICRVASAFKKFVNKKLKLKIKYDADAKIKIN